jgi:GAF domain-containing protein
MSVIWVLSSLGLLLPALMAMRLRRAWLLPAFLLWLALPIVVFAVVVIWEVQTGPPNPDAARNAWLGFYLLSGVAAVPWLVGSGLLFGLGLLLRRRFGPPAPPPVPSRPASSPPAWSSPAGTPPAAEPPLRIHSPDGDIAVELAPVEWANTLWVRSPRVTETATGRVLLDLQGTAWDCEVALPLTDSVLLHLRRYPDPQPWRVALDLAGRRFSISLGDRDGPALSRGALADLPARLDEVSRVAGALGTRHPPPPPRFAAWRIALAILVGAAIAIALGVWLTPERRKPVVLDSVPPPPVMRPR